MVHVHDRVAQDLGAGGRPYEARGRLRRPREHVRAPGERRLGHGGGVPPGEDRVGLCLQLPRRRTGSGIPARLAHAAESRPLANSEPRPTRSEGLVYSPEGCPFCGGDPLHRLTCPYIRWVVILLPVGFALVIALVLAAGSGDTSDAPAIDLRYLVVLFTVSVVVLLVWLTLVLRQRRR